jgi:GNAT superfamily N-acetyltransferase
VDDGLTFSVEQIGAGSAGEVAAMVRDLLEEIMAATGVRHFNVGRDQTEQRARDYIGRGIYTVFAAKELPGGRLAGFIALCETHALYAEGAFGIIPELYVRPAHRSLSVGAKLLEAAIVHGQGRGWKRLEVTTPPLPSFDRTLAFYERQGFTLAGGRKMKLEL